MLIINRDTFTRSLILESILFSHVYIDATFGTLTIAANQILILFANFSSHTLDGVPFFAESLPGRAGGSGSKSDVIRVSIICSFWSIIIATILTCMLVLFVQFIIHLIVKNEQFRAEFAIYFFWVVIIPACGISAWIVDGIFI